VEFNHAFRLHELGNRAGKRPFVVVLLPEVALCRVEWCQNHTFCLGVFHGRVMAVHGFQHLVEWVGVLAFVTVVQIISVNYLLTHIVFLSLGEQLDPIFSILHPWVFPYVSNRHSCSWVVVQNLPEQVSRRCRNAVLEGVLRSDDVPLQLG
jgi:hypothetical protein